MPVGPKLFEQPMKTVIELNPDHELVRLTKAIDWDELTLIAMEMRMREVITLTGPEPHYRELLGAVVLISVKNLDYRGAEEQIKYFIPARYLCDLMESPWTPDHVTIFDFTQMLGGEGMSAISSHVLDIARKQGLADPSELMSDTTAQEARIPYPNEVGLMSKYLEKVKKLTGKAGKKFTKARKKVKEVLSKVKGLVRSSHLFAKGKEKKQKITRKILHIIDDIHNSVQETIHSGRKLRSKAGEELTRLTEIMDTLLTQIWYFTETESVAAKKIIHLTMTELYSIVRGKAGKKVEFGLKWGINRIKGGFLMGFLIDGGKHLSDKRFAVEAIKVHMAEFGIAPEIYGFDRGGHSRANIKRAKKSGVKHVGIAPTGKTVWAVSKTMKKYITRERAQIEASIGTIKVLGFNKPHARSTKAMECCGHRSILGFNLKKLAREQAKLNLQTA